MIGVEGWMKACVGGVMNESPRERDFQLARHDGNAKEGRRELATL